MYWYLIQGFSYWKHCPSLSIFTLVNTYQLAMFVCFQCPWNARSPNTSSKFTTRTPRLRRQPWLARERSTLYRSTKATSPPTASRKWQSAMDKLTSSSKEWTEMYRKSTESVSMNVRKARLLSSPRPVSAAHVSHFGIFRSFLKWLNSNFDLCLYLLFSFYNFISSLVTV